MARTKRKLKGRAKAHVRFTKSERRKRIRASGATRTAVSRSSRRARRLAAKVAAKRK
jgi:hypothetical protein